MPTFESIQNQGNATFLDTVFETSCLTSGRQLPDLSPRHGSCGVVSPAFPFRGRKDAGTFGDGARPPSASSPVPCAQKCHTCFPHPIKEAAREFNKNTPQTWGKLFEHLCVSVQVGNTPTKWGRLRQTVRPPPGWRNTPTKVGKITPDGSPATRLEKHPHKVGKPPMFAFVLDKPLETPPQSGEDHL